MIFLFFIYIISNYVFDTELQETQYVPTFFILYLKLSVTGAQNTQQIKQN